LSKNLACGIQNAVLENEEGKSVVLPTKLIADKEILIESGPEPETPEKRVERQANDSMKGIFTVKI
jgi:hypothetical protein